MMLKKIKYQLENFIYNKVYGQEIYINDFNIKEKKLNIIYLTYFDSTFGINNVIKPLEEIGKVFKFQMTNTPHEKDWYQKKGKVN